MLRSGLIVKVPHAEPAVSAWRTQLMAALGVPANLTVLFPFVPPAGIDEATRTALRELLTVGPDVGGVVDLERATSSRGDRRTDERRQQRTVGHGW